MKHLLVPSSALLWGLQLAFLNPVLALLLVTMYRATPVEVGWALAVYNASGFAAAIAIPAYADRRGDYLRPMLLCAILTVLLVATLAATASLPVVVIALVALGGPATVGSSLLYAHLRSVGAPPAAVVNTRAIVSFAWVAGPPAATLVIGAFGSAAILGVLAAVAGLGILTTALMIARSRGPRSADGDRIVVPADHRAVPRPALAAVVGAFVLLQAANSASVSVMSLFVTQRLHLDLVWAGLALCLSALLEIPSLMIIGRLGARASSHALIVSGCLAAIGYFAGMAVVREPVGLMLLQVLSAWYYGIVVGVGLTLFQRLIRRPGLGSGLFANTRYIGAIVSGPIIAFGSSTPSGYRGVFVACGALTVVALGVAELARRLARAGASSASAASRFPEEPLED